MRANGLVIGAWAGYAAVALVHLVALGAGHTSLAVSTQPLLMPLLLLVLVAHRPRWNRTLVLAAMAIGAAGLGDVVPQALAEDARRTAAAALFLGTLMLYAGALLPLWWRQRSLSRTLLAIPVTAVVLGLAVSCLPGAAGRWLPMLLLYGLMLGVVAFLGAGVNGWTWVGSSLFLLSSTLIAMKWFLPGAWFPHADVVIMACYITAQALLLRGLLTAADDQPPRPRRLPQGGSTLVVVEG
ncbi:hypothetical protein JSY14_08375 [Brachybacterium sp. EF45031]|uniref:lysoplasmalogenase family protein n=1 Tax=Brachybacterium sillae TaxID=2810536 RepID=UPI00217D09DC|nr:lysoplasmalogenase family protein [Brachybacterium sillae]MCS6712033.1 hypothetical protein [Brachybacterium sillae]